MTQGNIRALHAVRDTLVDERRRAAKAGDATAVVAAQQQIEVLDAAIADERALGQAEKDEEGVQRGREEQIQDRYSRRNCRPEGCET